MHQLITHSFLSDDYLEIFEEFLFYQLFKYKQIAEREKKIKSLLHSEFRWKAKLAKAISIENQY